MAIHNSKKLVDYIINASSSSQYADVIDTRSALFNHYSREIADELISLSDSNIRDLIEIESVFTKKPDRIKISLLLQLSIKNSISKLLISNIKQDKYVAIVVPMYHENIRMHPRGSMDSGMTFSHTEIILNPHPQGEDFILEKTKQIEWLLSDNPLVKYSISFVDDGCDRDSGLLAGSVIRYYGLNKTHSVIFLSDEIEQHRYRKGLKSHAVREFPNSKHSKKAGAVYVGIANAIEDGADYIVYTDSDLSYSLSQLGRLISPLEGGKHIAVANRRDPLSIVEESVHQDSLTSGSMRVKVLLGMLRNTVLGEYLPKDTQSGFKIFTNEVAREILTFKGKDKEFSFDTVLLSIAAKMTGHLAVDVPVICFDSSDLSTADNETTYFNMIKAYLRSMDILGISKINNKTSEILHLLGVDYTANPRPIWKELHNVLSDTCSDSKTYNVSIVNRLKKLFDTSFHSTATDKTYSETDIDNLLEVLQEIKTKVI